MMQFYIIVRLIVFFTLVGIVLLWLLFHAIRRRPTRFNDITLRFDDGWKK